MNHYQRPLSHGRNSIFKPKQHTIHDHRGPKLQLHNDVKLEHGKAFQCTLTFNNSSILHYNTFDFMASDNV